MRSRNLLAGGLLGVGLVGCLVAGAAPGSASSTARATDFPTPIRHVVVILQENHSFDNVLGRLCIRQKRDCDAVRKGQRADGSAVRLSTATDVVPDVNHSQASELAGMNNGAMNGFESIVGCEQDQCYTQYAPKQIPSLAKVARVGAISDAFFSRDIVPSWGGHVDFFAQTLDGFEGGNPHHLKTAPPAGGGWGCDSNLDAMWMDPVTHVESWEPSCVPDQNGNGPYRPSPVPYVPTFGDRLDAAGRTWGIYGSVKPGDDKGVAYGWSICPTFAECLYGPQKNNMHEAPQLFTDAANGTLPDFTILVPNGASGATSQHNSTSMIIGDNYIGSEIAAIENGPDGRSTTIFVYYDDCGCFYDHVPPPAGLGIRLPLVISSPYAKRGYTDHNVSTNSSILTYTEYVLGVAPVNDWDATAYDFHDSFDYTQTPTPPFKYKPAPVPPGSRHLHPAPDDDT